MMLYHTLLCRLDVSYVSDLSSAGDIELLRETPPSSPSPVSRAGDIELLRTGDTTLKSLFRFSFFHPTMFTRFCKQKPSHDTTSPSLGWFHPFRDFVQRKDHEGCTAMDLALKVPHETFDVFSGCTLLSPLIPTQGGRMAQLPC